MKAFSRIVIAVFLGALWFQACSDGSEDCIDNDGDGYGVGTSCVGEDCDDNNSAVNPGEDEIPYDGLNNDCDSATVDDDLDGDGYLVAVDCDDTDEEIHPGAEEVCTDGVDNDCDQKTDAGDEACRSCSDSGDCDDGNSCTSDYCVQGFCRNQDAPDGFECDDGRFCTQPDVCSAGVCGGVDRVCDDGNDCTVDSCNEDQDRCDNLFQPRPGEEGTGVGGTCSNGADDDCDGLTDGDDPNCWTCSSDADCDDSNDCTQDSCSGSQCSNDALADGAACDDGLYCTIGETCRSGMCPLGAVRDCDDSDPCTADACDEELDRCDNILKPEPGQEGLDMGDSCSNQLDDDCDRLVDGDDPNCWNCTQDGECDDGNECTDDTCDDGQCSNTPVAGAPDCNDGLYCTTGETCAGGVCQFGADRDCDDGERCTVDSCDEENDQCENTWQERPGEEGLTVAGSCVDQDDNDCDGLTDIFDPECWHGLCAVDLEADPPVIEPDGVSTSTITATAHNDSGAEMPDGTEIVFSTTLGTFVESGTTTHTAATASGVATATLQSEVVAENTTVTVTAAYTCDNGEETDNTVLVTFGQGGPPIVFLSASSSWVIADDVSTVDLTAEVYLPGGVPAGAGEEVTFSADLGRFQESDAATYVAYTNAGGVATATFIGGSQGGTSSVQASVLIQSMPASDQVEISIKQLGFLEFISAVPDKMGVKGSGRNESSLVTFQVKDTEGLPFPPGALVEFTLSMAPGVTLDSPTDRTDSQGMVEAVLNSGNTATTVTVTATAHVGTETLQAVSPAIAIVGAMPSNKYMAFSCEHLNVGGLVLDFVQTDCTVSLADRFSNRIGFATNVVFRTEAGSINASALTSDSGSDMGEAVATIRTGAPLPKDVDPVAGEPFIGDHNPRDGIVAIIVAAVGEEGFDDSNGNGRYDAGESFAQWDRGEPFVDKDDDGVHDPDEMFIDANNNMSYDGPNGRWDGDTLIWEVTHMLWTGEAEYAGAGDCSAQYRYSIVCPDTFDIQKGGEQQFDWEVKDINLNPLNSSLLVDFSVTGKGSAGASDPPLAWQAPDTLGGFEDPAYWSACGGGFCGWFKAQGAPLNDPNPQEAGTVSLDVTYNQSPGAGALRDETITVSGMFE
jgi:hypothetical protein